MSNIVSASSLKRCGLAVRLGKLRKPSRNSVIAMEKGSKFHGAIEQYFKMGIAMPIDDPEVVAWLDALVSQWKPPSNAVHEVVLGLDQDGCHVPTRETCEDPHSHVYEPVPPVVFPLLTAGRADIAWVEEIP